MTVNRFKITIPTLSSGETHFHIPIVMSSQNALAGQTELIDEVFVKNEIKSSINPILDYEKARFVPYYNIRINMVIYNLSFLSGNKYGNIGFTDNDIKFRKNNFKQSFLRLSFYDSPNPLEQQLVSFVTLYPYLTPLDFLPNGDVKPANQIPIAFVLTDTIPNKKTNTEGFGLYNYRSDVFNQPKELFMKASFNNAKTGKSTNLMIENTAYNIDQLVNKLYTKYTLIKDTDKYYYTIDPTYKTPTNVSYVGNTAIINLYEIQVL